MGNIVTIDRALDITDVNVSAELMAELLMDDTVSTYKMFETLANNYLLGSSEYQKGVDATLLELIGCDMTDLAALVIQRIEEQG